MPKHIQYSERYRDDKYEYRHVILPQDVSSLCPKGRLLSESEWRNLGIQQSKGWIHYAIHRPEVHVLLFRRPIVPIVPIVPITSSDTNGTKENLKNTEKKESEKSETLNHNNNKEKGC